jgi:hypothetical protein
MVGMIPEGEDGALALGREVFVVVRGFRFLGFWVFARFLLSDFFITISYRPWRHVISRGLELTLGPMYVAVGVGVGVLLFRSSRVLF